MIELLPLLFAIPAFFVPGAIVIGGVPPGAGTYPVYTRLAEAILLSSCIAGFSVFFAFVIGVPAEPIVGGIVAASFALLWFRRRLISSYVSRADVQLLFVAFLVLEVACLTLVSAVRSYSGGLWCCDWEEHFERTRFFLETRPLDRLFGGYQLGARPPLGNLIAAFPLALVPHRFEAYQLVMATCGALLIFPLAAIAAGLGRSSPLLLACALLANPMFVQNMLFPWTKLISAGFIVHGAHLAISAALHRAAVPAHAYLWLGAGGAVHYSAAPWIIGAAMLDIWSPGRSAGEKLRGVAVAVLCSLIPLLPWLTWSSFELGVRATFLSNTSITDSATMSFRQNFLKMLANSTLTIVPAHFVLFSLPELYGNGPLRSLREGAFMLYQNNLLVAFGSVGLIVLTQQTKAVLHNETRRCFVVSAVAIIVIGTAVIGSLSPFGLAHICLQPAVYLAIPLLAHVFTESTSLIRRAILAGWLIDVSLGTLLHVWYQRYLFAGPDWDLKVAGGCALSETNRWRCRPRGSFSS